MPELPEVETMRRGITDFAGRRLIAVSSCRCRAKPIEIRPTLATLRRRLVGATLSSVDRVGKRLVLNFAAAGCVVIEPRMTGLVVRADPPSRTHLRVRFQFAGQDANQFWYWDRRGLGKILYYTAETWREFLASGRVGPDALAIPVRSFQAALANSRSPIKVALLDQRRVSGIGNLYASELLFVSRVDPRRPCNSLAPAEWRRIWQAMRRVLREAIRYEGSTLADGTYRNTLSQQGSYQDHHRVYAKAGKPCPRCRTSRIERIVQGQRSTFFCPACQSSTSP